MITIRLTNPQADFIEATEQFPCICAGFGAGKTQSAIYRALHRKLTYPKQSVAYYLPTYDLVKKIGYPRFEEALDTMKTRSKTNKSDHIIEIHGAGQIIFRTMDEPHRIVGYEVADSLVDELDTLKRDHAELVWRAIVSRNRQKKPDGSLNTIGVATTPEGFKFVYERWGKTTTPGYRLIKASTYSNERNLPAGYIQSLKDTYPPHTLAAYLNGEFVNLTSGGVYPDFRRALNGSTETIKPNETLHIGLDFNVTKMAAVVHVLRDGEPHAVDELVDVFDTPAMAKLITERFKDKGHPIMMYPDASGGARKSSDASVSDLAILKQAGFTVCVNSRNPAVRDRVLATNAMINKEGKRQYHVNGDACPHVVEALEQQCYDKNGEPDKSSGVDHVLDATTYFVAYRWPIVKPTAIVTALRM